MNKTIPVFVILTVVLSLSLNTIPNVYSFSEENPTDKNTLNVKLETEPETPIPSENTKLKIEFINPQTKKIQEHIDYSIKIENNGSAVFGPIPLTHTSPGNVSIPVTLENGKNTITVDVEGILFQPIPKEIVTFDVVIGEELQEDNKSQEPEEKLDTSVGDNTKEDSNSDQDSSSQVIPEWIKTNAGWWANDEIDDNTFVSGIQYLIKEKIISVSSSSSSNENTTQEIPDWIKNNAEWWSQEMISDDDFLKGIEFLVKNGIIVVQ
ncbi:MAG: hypothetical protein ACR2LL_01005 [Nitrosopumilus sp.]